MVRSRQKQELRLEPADYKASFLIRVFIAYDSKYGNTKLAAQSILMGIKETMDSVDAAIGYVKETEPGSLSKYDVIIFGAPNHMGRPSRTMKKFVDKLGKIHLRANGVAVFGTYAGRERPVDRAVKKLERMAQKQLPNVSLILPSLSVRVNGVKGPIMEGELPKCVEFGRKLVSQLKQGQIATDKDS